MKSSTVFSKCARKTGFAGTSTTRYRLLDDALLVVNHQRASESRGFYVNAGLLCLGSCPDQAQSPGDPGGSDDAASALKPSSLQSRFSASAA